MSHSCGGQKSEIKVLMGPHCLWRLQGRHLFFASPSSWWRLAFLVAASRQSLSPWWQCHLLFCLCQVSPCLPACLPAYLFVGHLSLDLGSHLKTLTSSHLQRPLFQVRSHSPVPRIRTWTYLFGATVQHTASKERRSVNRTKWVGGINIQRPQSGPSPYWDMLYDFVGVVWREVFGESR